MNNFPCRILVQTPNTHAPSRRYPFHLRPKSRQLHQYYRMAVDLVHDLELEDEAASDLAALAPEQCAQSLDRMRALLACFYVNST